ncbi:amidase signature enzyme [Aspergillus ellipticus CBS 707.79]|uniref:Amidase signature enzyme n=1 Tax=Aspergillus ellipticus CBS 707.79 TaxID=1448320 RepID=A0A319DC39_9EURO|nr:amidase signature enzyme [Aspergillus ellipticus CBS 707.79]
MAPFNIRTATATELSDLLNTGRVSSVDIVTACLAQIQQHHRAGLGLRALISVHPETALAQAADRDRERAQGQVRSGLHGIPIIVKDAIITCRALGLPTTAGAVAFQDT